MKPRDAQFRWVYVVVIAAPSALKTFTFHEVPLLGHLALKICFLHHLTIEEDATAVQLHRRFLEASFCYLTASAMKL